MAGVLKYTFVAWLLAAPAALWAADFSLFWSFSGPGGHAGYVLGTIHSEDPRVLEYSDAFLQALGSSEVFAMELVPDVFTMARLMEYMHLPEGQSQATLLGEQRFRAVTDALGTYGLTTEQVARMKPWAAMMTLSVPPPSSGLFMDFSLSLRASGSGLKVIGLETLEQQLAFLEDLGLEQQLMLLDHALAGFGQVREVHDRMVDTYLQGDLAQLERQAEEQMRSLEPELHAYFVDEGIVKRNHRMLATLLPVLSDQTVFVAVGALHLPGPDGLVELLRGAGYLLSPEPSPFAGVVNASEKSGSPAPPQ